jgi:hypothetical protein
VPYNLSFTVAARMFLRLNAIEVGQGRRNRLSGSRRRVSVRGVQRVGAETFHFAEVLDLFV